MTIPTSLKWIAGVFFVPVVLAILFIAFFGWNWLHGPIERMALEKTGRELVINGDIEVMFGWHQPRIHATKVSFANPAWAKAKQMVSADDVEITIDLPQIFWQNIVFPEVHLKRPLIFLEQGANGQKNWLLDHQQQDESARIRIDRLTLDNGTLGYDDVEQKTSIRMELSTQKTTSGDGELIFAARGQYKGMNLKAKGNGGPVLGLRDERSPYPLKANLTVGLTVAQVEGTITSLLKFSAMDMRLALRGESLAQLFPLLGIAFPETRAYSTDGRITHNEQTWRYEKFTGRIGESDIAGSLQIDTGGQRTLMKADLVSNRLDLADLGPLIGARPGRLDVAVQAAPSPSQTDVLIPERARVLPDMPFKTDRWDSVDAEVSLKAKNIHSVGLPLEDLVTHLSLHDSVLTLDPLDFGVAGGHLNAVISLDGRVNPIQASAKVRARKLHISSLFPGVDLSKASIGQINGEFDLAGNGNSVRQMLGRSKGKVGLVVAGGEISQMMMERAGMHLWEILGLNMTGDKLVKLRCGVADFNVSEGIMHADALVFDTEVTTIIGTGTIDFGQEKLDLTLNQKTKNTSPLALRSPIHVRGSFARPEAKVDKGQVAARAFGAIALGMLNPVLALIPLIDAGPGVDSDCRHLIQEARALPRDGHKKTDPRPEE